VQRYWRRQPWSWLKMQTVNLVSAAVLFARLMQGVPEASLRREYRRRVWRLLRARPDPNLLVLYLLKCAMHYHQHTLAQQMAAEGSQVVNSF
jgi:hypothetical protein